MTILDKAGTDFNSFTYQSLQNDVLDIVNACFVNVQNRLNNAIVAKSVSCLVLSLAFHTQISNELFQQMLQFMYEAISSKHPDTDERLHIEATQFWGHVLHFPRFA
uniref:Uncharacterized protein n=1 Tax=Lygus hesperus TaxID=30085 RepID=A0A146MIR4_LYGHE